MFKKKKLLIPLFVSICFLSSCRDDLSMYYNMSLDKGMEVYTHVLSEDNYEFGFMSGTNRRKSAEEVNRLIYVSIKKAKVIVRSYGDRISKDNLDVILIPNPCTDEDLAQGKDESQRNIVLEIEEMLLEN